MNYFVTAIGTDSGKTVASAILAEALGADYWKPVQAGRPTDSDFIRKVVSPGRVRIHQEQYLLKTPISPHAAAAAENLKISISDIILPETSNSLIIEGAGGILVPLNDDEMMIDLVPHLNAAIILVCNIYLGSINHSLLSLELIRSRGYPLRGIIFNGPRVSATEKIIMKYANVDCLLHIHEEKNITRQVIAKYAAALKNTLNIK